MTGGEGEVVVESYAVEGVAQFGEDGEDVRKRDRKPGEERCASAGRVRDVSGQR